MQEVHMLFDSLDKLKRNSILSAILLIFLGAIIIICPQSYIPALTLAFGYILVIIAIILVLGFLSSKKSLMDYIKFTGSLILGLVGVAVLAYRSDVMRVLAWLFAFLLILDGIDIQPKTATDMPLIAVVGIVFAIALAIYSVAKLTKNK